MTSVKKVSDYFNSLNIGDMMLKDMNMAKNETDTTT